MLYQVLKQLSLDTTEQTPIGDPQEFADDAEAQAYLNTLQANDPDHVPYFTDRRIGSGDACLESVYP